MEICCTTLKKKGADGVGRLSVILDNELITMAEFIEFFNNSQEVRKAREKKAKTKEKAWINPRCFNPKRQRGY